MIIGIIACTDFAAPSAYLGGILHMKKHQLGFGIHYRVLALAVAAALGLGGCTVAAKSDPVAADETPAVLVEAATPKIGDLTLTTEFIGTVEPNEVVSVLPKMSGTVLNTFYKVGDLVNKGDLLFSLDPQDVQLQVNIARAQLKSSQAQLMSAQAQMDQALGSSFDLQMAQLEGQVKQAQNAYSNARQSLRDYNDGAEDAMDSLLNDMDAMGNRIPQLENYIEDAKKAAEEADKVYRELDAKHDLDPNSVTEEELAIALKNASVTKGEQTKFESSLKRTEDLMDTAHDTYDGMDSDNDPKRSQLRTAVRNAQTAYESSTEIYELTKDSVRDDAVKVANASLGAATAGFETASASFEASARQLDNTKVYAPISGVIEQKNITEQAVAAPSAPAYTISNKSTILVTFFVPSDAIAQLSHGERVEVEYGQQKYIATIAELGTMVDPQSGLFKVKAAVDGGGDGLLTGLTVKVKAATAKASQSLLIPQSVVYFEDGKPYIYTLNGTTAVKTYITTGVTTDDQVEVLSGIGRATRFISSWSPNLTDGVTVTVSPDSPQDDPAVSAASESASMDTALASSEANNSSSTADDSAAVAAVSGDGENLTGAKYVAPFSDEELGGAGNSSASASSNLPAPVEAPSTPEAPKSATNAADSASGASSKSKANGASSKDLSPKSASSKSAKSSAAKDGASTEATSSDSSRKLAAKEG